MKVWIVKYALTQGIEENEGTIEEKYGSGNDVISVKSTGHFINSTTLYHKNEWADSEEKAKIMANEKKDKKIKSLEKQIEKLKKMKFE